MQLAAAGNACFFVLAGQRSTDAEGHASNALENAHVGYIDSLSQVVAAVISAANELKQAR